MKKLQRKLTVIQKHLVTPAIAILIILGAWGWFYLLATDPAAALLLK